MSAYVSAGLPRGEDLSAATCSKISSAIHHCVSCSKRGSGNSYEGSSSAGCRFKLLGTRYFAAFHLCYLAWKTSSCHIKCSKIVLCLVTEHGALLWSDPSLFICALGLYMLVYTDSMPSAFSPMHCFQLSVMRLLIWDLSNLTCAFMLIMTVGQDFILNLNCRFQQIAWS